MDLKGSVVYGVSLLWAVLLSVVSTGPRAHAADSSVVEKAKAEGEVVLYTAWGLDGVQALQKAFTQKYPFIKLNVLRMRSERILSRTIAEHRQKVYQADVFSGSQLAMLNHKKEGHLQKYISPEQAAFPREFKDAESFWTAVHIDTRVLAYNTKLISRNEVPRTYDDLIHPKWKGKMAIDEAEYIMYGTILEMMGREKGGAFMKRLSQQDLSLRNGHSLLTQLLIAGEFPIYADAFGSNIEPFKAKGAPIDWVGLQPVIVSLYPAGMAVNAPHPNAAKLLVDFFLSKEGQQIGKAIGKMPGRSDVEPPYPNLTKGLKLYPVPAVVAERYGEITKEFRELFLK